MSAAPGGAVVFDIGRVLVDFDVARAVRGVARLAQVGEYEAEFALFGPHHRALNRGEIGPIEFHAEVCRHLGRQVEYAPFAEAWCDMFDEVSGMEPLVASLSHRVPLYLCSNTDPIHYPHLRAAHPLLSFSAGAILSYEVGSEKPEPAIFEALLSRFRLDPGRTLFIDDREENVVGAASLGIAGLVFESVDDLRADLRARDLLPP